MTLKTHLAMKYLGAFNTTYLAFIEYQQRKCKKKKTLLKKILETNHWPLLNTKMMVHKLNFFVEVKQGLSNEVLYQCSIKYACI